MMLFPTRPYGPGHTRKILQGSRFGEIGPGDNESIALLLVEASLEWQGTDIDTDDDGAFDAAPWTTIMDAVGFGAEFYPKRKTSQI